MRRYFCWILVTGCFLSASTSVAQTLATPDVIRVDLQSDKKAAEKPATLEQLIAEALKSNPDIRVAESKVRETDAELGRTRLKVVSDVTFLHAEIQAAKAMVDFTQKQHTRLLALEKNLAVDPHSVSEAALALEKAKADLAAKQAKLPYLLGKQTGSATSLIDALLKNYSDAKITDEEFLLRAMLDMLGRVPTPEEMKEFLKTPAKDRREKWIGNLQNKAVHEQAYIPARFYEAFPRMPEQTYRLDWNTPTKTATPLTNKLRTALDATATLKQQGSPEDYLNFLRKELLPGINLQTRAKLANIPIDLKLTEPVAVGAILQFLEEELKVIFVLRDYGIVVVAADERLPPGAVRVVDFWKHGQTDGPGPEKAK
jgi:hypothetical protein